MSSLQIDSFHTDISNWGELGNLKLRGNKTRKTGTLDEVIDYAKSFLGNTSIAVFIVKTSYVSDVKPGAWYIKGTKNTTVPYEIIKRKCEENTENGKWNSRESYLIRLT